MYRVFFRLKVSGITCCGTKPYFSMQLIVYSQSPPSETGFRSRWTRWRSSMSRSRYSIIFSRK
jgi:hypothetical protein